MRDADLVAQEQTHVRTALKFLRTRCGGWVPVAKALRTKDTTIATMARGGVVSARIAFRVARLVGVTVDDVITGRFPSPGTCPHCGHRKEEAEAAQ